MLELKHLSKAFDGHTVLNDINLTGWLKEMDFQPLTDIAQG